MIQNIRSYGELRRTPYGLTPVLVLAGVSFFQGLEATAFQLGAPELIRNGISVIDIVRVSQVVSVAMLVGSLGIAWMADRARRVPIFTIGTVLAGVAAMLTALRPHSAATVGGARVARATVNVASDIPVGSLLADYYPPGMRGRVYALLSTVGALGGVIALPIAAIMVVRFGLAATSLILGAPVVILGIVAALVLREPIRGYFERQALGAGDDVARREDEPQSFGESWRTVFAVRTLRRLFLSALIINVASAPLSLFVTLHLIEHYGLGIGQRALLALPAIALSLVGGIYGGGLVDKLAGRNPGRVLTVYGVFPLIAAVGILGYALTPPLPALIVFNAVVAFGSALIGPAVGAVYSQVVPPTVRTLGFQFDNLSALSGIVIGFQLLWLVRADYGFGAVCLLAAPFYVIGGIVAMTAGPLFGADRRAAMATALAAADWREAKRAGGPKLLVCRDVDVHYDGLQVLFGIDFAVADGELVALLGPNGAGKSTLLRAISGTVQASSGAIVFDGRDITHMPPHEIARRRVVLMPGGRGTFPGLSVRDNLLLAAASFDGPERARSAANDVLDFFPVLRERPHALAAALSAGQQQQLSLAQAFLMNPALLLLDELTLGLSPAAASTVLEAVVEMNQRGVTIIVVEPSVHVALTLASRAVFMEKGQITFDGAAHELMAQPDVVGRLHVRGTGPETARVDLFPQDRGHREAGTSLLSGVPILEVRGLTKAFGGNVAVNQVSLHVEDRGVVGIIGPNGSGKTTLFDLISGFQAPDAGAVSFEGADITSLSAEERARRKLIRRFQDARLFPSLTVGETLLVALDHRLEVKSALLHAAALPRARSAERRLLARADRLLDLLELGPFRDKLVKELPTGIRRFVDLACVLSAEPRLLLLDEPSAGIARTDVEGLVSLLRRVRADTACSILIIEHDMSLIAAVADELIALDRGEVVVRGRPDEVLGHALVIDSYLGGRDVAGSRTGPSQ